MAEKSKPLELDPDELLLLLQLTSTNVLANKLVPKNKEANRLDFKIDFTHPP